MTRRSITACAITAIFLLASLGPSRAASREELRLASGSTVATFDPSNYRSVFDLLVDNLITDTLVGSDAQMRPVPRLALSWQQVNPVTWRFKLRPNVKFQDGVPMDADAVRLNFERSSQALKGSRFYGEIKEVQVLDPLTVQFVLKRPFAPFFYNLMFSAGGLISPEALRKRIDPKEKLIGTGPYALAEWVPNNRVVLVRNNTYWGPKPRLSRVVVRWIEDESTRYLALLRGEADVVEAPPPHQVTLLRTSGVFDLVRAPLAQLLWVGFNAKDPILKDKRVREAIAYGVDRKAIVQQDLEGVPREADSGLIPPEVLATKPPLRYDYNPEKAKQLLAQAGYASGLKLSLWTTRGVWLGDQSIAEVVQAQLAKIGVNVGIREMDYGSLSDGLSRHEQQLYIVLWGFTAHPDSMLRGVFFSKSAANWSAYVNPEIDTLLDDAVGVTDPQKMQQAYWKIQQKLMDDAALVPIYYAVNLYAESKKVHNFVANGLDLIDLTQTWVDQ